MMLLAHGHHPLHATEAAATGWLLPAAAFAVLTGGYFVLLLRRNLVLQRSWSPWRGLSWLMGALLIATALSPAVESGQPMAGHLQHSAGAHMLQHLLLGMLGPLFLVLAAPITVLLGAVGPRTRRVLGRALRSGAVHVLGHPVTAAVLHIVPLFLLYLTPLYPAVMSNPPLHALLNLHFLLSGCLYAWSLAGADPAPRRPGIIARAGVLILSAGLHAWLATLIYARAHTLPAAQLHSPEDLQAAAQLMYYGGDAVELALAVAMFAGWYRHRQRRVRRADRVRPVSVSKKNKFDVFPSQVHLP